MVVAGFSQKADQGNPSMHSSDLAGSTGVCSRCSNLTFCKPREFSAKAWHALKVWHEVDEKLGSHEQAIPICNDCYLELREILIDRADEVEYAATLTPEPLPAAKPIRKVLTDDDEPVPAALSKNTVASKKKPAANSGKSLNLKENNLVNAASPQAAARNKIEAGDEEGKSGNRSLFRKVADTVKGAMHRRKGAEDDGLETVKAKAQAPVQEKAAGKAKVVPPVKPTAKPAVSKSTSLPKAASPLKSAAPKIAKKAEVVKKPVKKAALPAKQAKKAASKAKPVAKKPAVKTSTSKKATKKPAPAKSTKSKKKR